MVVVCRTVRTGEEFISDGSWAAVNSWIGSRASVTVWDFQAVGMASIDTDDELTRMYTFGDLKGAS